MRLETNDLKIGQIVRSKAGRDRGDWMIVIDILNDDYVNVCNGKNRKVSSPKKKKVKHLAKTNHISSLIQSKLDKNIKITNHDIRTILEPYNKKELDNQE